LVASKKIIYHKVLRLMIWDSTVDRTWKYMGVPHDYDTSKVIPLCICKMLKTYSMRCRIR
jgi:hypothetical protein